MGGTSRCSVSGLREASELNLKVVVGVPWLARVAGASQVYGKLKVQSLQTSQLPFTLFKSAVEPMAM